MKSFAITDVGKTRKVNQDYIFSSDEAVGILPSLYIVADGMGGHKAGDYASRFCVENFITQIKENPQMTLLSTIRDSIININAELFVNASQREDLKGCGTTFVLTVVDGTKAYIANVGDSRMYWLTGGFLRQISQDHSLVETMIRKGELERRDAVYHPKKNVITRAMGVEEEVEPDFFEIDINIGDYILMCSDGLTNMVDDESITEVLLDTELSAEGKARALVEKANNKGGKDNISVCIIEI